MGLHVLFLHAIFPCVAALISILLTYIPTSFTEKGVTFVPLVFKHVGVSPTLSYSLMLEPHPLRMNIHVQHACTNVKVITTNKEVFNLLSCT